MGQRAHQREVRGRAHRHGHALAREIAERRDASVVADHQALGLADDLRQHEELEVDALARCDGEGRGPQLGDLDVAGGHGGDHVRPRGELPPFDVPAGRRLEGALGAGDLHGGGVAELADHHGLGRGGGAAKRKSGRAGQEGPGRHLVSPLLMGGLWRPLVVPR
nr:hypothetical protein [Rubellimicrobium mesophilum]